MLDFEKLANQRENLLLPLPGPGEFQRLVSFAVDSRPHIGVLSDDFPLLRHLTIKENIALPMLFKQNIHLSRLEPTIRNGAGRLGLAHYLDRFPTTLPYAGKIRAMFLRCVVAGNNSILLPSPKRDDVEILFDCLASEIYDVKIWVACQENCSPYNDFPLQTMIIH